MMNKLRPLVAVMLAAAACAGCGSNATTGGSSGSARLTVRAKLVKLAQCLRTHGVSDFPDPNAKNDFDYGISVSQEVWTRAVDACKDLEPPGEFSSKRTPAQQSAGLKFAACIRANGVKDFPDPVAGEPLIDTTRIPSSSRAGGMTILNAAIAKCRTDLSDAVADR
jgi:hypothetical protein